MIKLITLVLLIPILTFAQKTKEIKIKFPKSKQVKEIYYVLKTDKSVKHGNYTVYHKNIGSFFNSDLIYETGQYVNGLKEGEWTTYRSPQKKGTRGSCCAVYKKGHYTNGKKTGVWYTKSSNQSDPSYFDYDLNKEIQRDPPGRIVSVDVSETGCTMNVIVKINSDCSITNYRVVSKYENGFDCSESDLESIKKQALNIGSNSDKCFDIEMPLRVTAR
tara:strand:+ start:765 stop:1418 length:654 start_codon:yes stop_codon:yes gene_type:complete